MWYSACIAADCAVAWQQLIAFETTDPQVMDPTYAFYIFCIILQLGFLTYEGNWMKTEVTK